MGDSQASSKQKLKQIIFEGILKSLDIVVSCHSTNCTPRTKEKKTNSQYIDTNTKELNSNLYLPYRLDIYLDVDNNNGLSSVLIERWMLHFDNRKRDAKEARAATLNKQISILMRTLYCFVRLLPSFQFSSQSTHCPLSFRIYPFNNNSSNNDDKFLVKAIHYHFPSIATQHGYFTLSLNYLDSSSIKNIYSPPRSETIPIPPNNININNRNMNMNNNMNMNMNNGHHHDNNQNINNQNKFDVQKTPSRRHSTTTTPNSLPGSHEHLMSTNQLSGDMASTWNSYSGGLRSPTQRPNSLIGIPINGQSHDNKSNLHNNNNNNNNNSYNNNNNNNSEHNNDNDVFPNPPELARNQSRSADSKPNYLLNDHYFGTTKGSENFRERERSISADKERLSLRNGRPPQHPDISSYSSHGSSPYLNNLPAPFYIGGGSYTPSEGGGLLGGGGSGGDDILSDVSPPFQVPCALLSTSPSTGPGSSIAVLREQLIGNNRIGIIEKNPKREVRLEQNFLPELPESPFDTELFNNNNNNKDNNNSADGDLDTHFMFQYDDIEIGDEMPFVWNQTPPVDSFLLQNSKHINSSGKSNSLPTSKQSSLTQQCLTPPILNVFDNSTFDGQKSSIDAFAQLDKMKHHMNTLIAKS